jgi:hypothetical protein
MGKINQLLSASEINSIITNQMSQMESSNAVMVNDSSLTIQMINNSTNCTNRKITFSRDTYVSDGTVFMSDLAVQTLVASVMNEISSTYDAEQTGFSIGQTNQELDATIQNIIATSLTQQSITTYVSSVFNSNNSIQICYGASNSGNYIFGSTHDIYNFYFEQYTKMAQVQQVSADISNVIDASFSAKQTGIVAILARMVTVICIIIIIVVAIVVVVVLFGIVV